MAPTINHTRNPWWWIPTLYFAEGIPYVIVNTISVILFKKMGLGNADVALYTSLLYLPWVIKPLWSPIVDILRSKRWWIVSMQLLMTVSFALTALFLPRQTGAEVSPFILTLILFYVSAVASATHDIAADGYYMIALDDHQQSVFVGIRSTFYRIATVFGNGLIVLLAGWLELRFGDVPKAWRMTMFVCAALLAFLSVWHWFTLPKKEAVRGERPSLGQVFKEFGRTFYLFFVRSKIGVALAFMLLYRLPEAFSVKMLTPFMLDGREVGGLGLSTADVGLLYGTIGVIALTLGGILGGLACGKWGLKKSLWPMALSLALPCGVYLYMAVFQPTSLWVIGSLVALDQFGYGFGFTAYMLYLIWFSQGEFKTSHYAL
ncbi:MAG: MFS transporter, partial [Bacteroidales bacterium]|nr:MFS transporter [Bacteroidales bacterium]